MLRKDASVFVEDCQQLTHICTFSRLSSSTLERYEKNVQLVADPYDCAPLGELSIIRPLEYGLLVLVPYVQGIHSGVRIGSGLFREQLAASIKRVGNQHHPTPCVASLKILPPSMFPSRLPADNTTHDLTLPDLPCAVPVGWLFKGVPQHHRTADLAVIAESLTQEQQVSGSG